MAPLLDSSIVNLLIEQNRFAFGMRYYIMCCIHIVIYAFQLAENHYMIGRRSLLVFGGEMIT